MIARHALVVLGVIPLTFIAIACGGAAQPTPQVTQIAVSPTTDAAAPEIAAAQADGGASTSAQPMSDADKVIAGLRARFKRCYNLGLRVDPTMSGRVVMRIVVDPSGTITSGETVQREGLSLEVAACILAEIQTARFAPPGENGAILMVPVKFVQQSKDAGASAAP